MVRASSSGVSSAYAGGRNQRSTRPTQRSMREVVWLNRLSFNIGLHR